MSFTWKSGNRRRPRRNRPARAVADALETETLGYTLALGLDELRSRIAGLYKRWYGIDLDPNRVVVTSGSSAAFLLAFLSVFDVGQKVGLPNPGYPCYRHILTALGIGSTSDRYRSGFALDADA